MVAAHRFTYDREPSSPAGNLDQESVPVARWRGKRVLDVALASLGALATAPLVAALGVVIRIDSPGPALFWQRRVGRDRRLFTLVKLRTMHEGRITRVGRVLRPSGLDELPQLWNVLRGDMSLIGPRPEVPERVERYAREIAGYQERHRVDPGISGWAQVNGLRGNVSIRERLRFDREYIRRASMAMDLMILGATLSTVWRDTVRSRRRAP
jgi:lipopolysaccharide/colanic/teichoic acid biosynthesis glycosyltransferase